MSDAAARLLVVEDEAKVARFIEKGLREESYEVDVAEDMRGATELLTRAGCLDPGGGPGCYELLILDWMLPDGDGLALAQRVRSQGNAVPILFLTARDAVSERVAALDAGADDYLVKPFAFAELVARVRALLRRGQGRLSRLRIQDIEVDLTQRTVQRGGVPIALTGKEFAVLAYLARHPGRAVSRAELLQQVWAHAGDTSAVANVVDAQVMRLREKLDAGSREPVIHTVRRIGYALGPLASPEQAAAPKPRG